MNFKRIIVLVMALVMMVSACAPSVLAAYDYETHHEHLEEKVDSVLNNPEYQEKYEEIKATVEYIVKDIEENHEEYYANGYAYALENGYLDAAIEAIKVALETLPQIDLSEAEISDELRADLEAELDALVPTLEKLLAVLESGEASEFDGFVNAMLTFEGDLYLHMNNIYAILEQANVDYLVPAFHAAMEYLNEVLLPAVDAAVEAFVNAVVDYVVEALTPYYEKVVEILNITRDTYNKIVETIVKINLYVENQIQAVVNAYNALVATLLEIYGTVEEAVNTACEIYNKVVDTIVELNARVENALENLENTIVAAVNAYRFTVKVLVKAYGFTVNAATVAMQIYDRVVEFIVENKHYVEEGIELAGKIYADIVEIIETAYEVNESAHAVALQISAYVAELIKNIENAINDTLHGALNGNYELKDDSYYVSIGQAPFGEELAGMLNLGEKYHNFGIKGDYLDAVAGADLVTVKADDDSYIAYAYAQVMGVVAELVRSNADLMSLYNHPIVGSYVKDAIADTGIDLEASPAELDWNKYLNAEGQAALDNALAMLKAELLEQGAPEYYYFELTPLVDKVFEENGLAGLPGISVEIDPIVVPAVDLAVYAIENMLYAYAEYAQRLTTTLENVYAAAPNATVVLVGVTNPVGTYLDESVFNDCGKNAVQTVVDVLNAHLYAVALVNENTIFVEENDAQAIYDALHVYCDHVYDDCVDEDCNRCLQVRVAPGHSYVYSYNNDATCTEDGTEHGICVNCGAENTRTVAGTALGHDWRDATCTTPKTCNVCGKTQGSTKPHTWESATCTTARKCKVCGKVDGEALGHRFGNWTVVEEATTKHTGLETRVCRSCGKVETRVLPIIPPDHTTLEIVLVIVAGIVTSVAIGAFLLWKDSKKDYVNGK